MRLDHLNFCRQIRAEFEHPRVVIKPQDQDKRVALALVKHYAQLTATAQKFILPDGGYLLDDPGLRALDDSEPLRLPFPSIALEYLADESQMGPDETHAPKRVIFAREVSLPDDSKTVGAITIGSVVYANIYSSWIPYPEIQIGLFGYVDRTKKNEFGRFLYRIRAAQSVLDDARLVKDYAAEVDVLLSFLNSLQCSNVAIDRSDPRKSKIKHQGQGVLAFDSYHYLTIASPTGEHGEPNGPHSHRSPREHVRRGHVRRLHSGHKTWVNSAVINAGKGGKVAKDYIVEAK